MKKLNIGLIILVIVIFLGIIALFKIESTQTTKCLPEQRNVDGCIEIYQPVCATVNVQCVTTPCDPVKETFENSCKACVNPLVSVYSEGEC
jgi:putative cell wall-binding protein